MKKLPIGIQSIEKILSNSEYVYVDKTGLIKKLIDQGAPHYFISLVKGFTSIPKLRSSEGFIKALESYQVEFLFKHLELGFSSLAYQVFVDAKECTYQGMLLSMLYGMGFDPLSEKSTNVGRIDVVLEVTNTTYIMELKLNKSSNAALKQIHDKGYFKPYTHKGKKIVIIGANFSSKERNISNWKAELLSESGEVVKEILSEKGE